MATVASSYFITEYCKASLSESFMDTVIQTENWVTVSDKFHGDETLLTFHEILAFSLLTMSAKVMVFNVMKPPLRLALANGKQCDMRVCIEDSV